MKRILGHLTDEQLMDSFIQLASKNDGQCADIVMAVRLFGNEIAYRDNNRNLWGGDYTNSQ